MFFFFLGIHRVPFLIPVKVFYKIPFGNFLEVFIVISKNSSRNFSWDSSKFFFILKRVFFSSSSWKFFWDLYMNFFRSSFWDSYKKFILGSMDFVGFPSESSLEILPDITLGFLPSRTPSFSRSSFRFFFKNLPKIFQKLEKLRKSSFWEPSWSSIRKPFRNSSWNPLGVTRWIRSEVPSWWKTSAF